MIDATNARPGDMVRYVGPSMFDSGKNWIGKLARLPIPRERVAEHDDRPGYCLVQRGTEKRPRAVRAEDLERA